MCICGLVKDPSQPQQGAISGGLQKIGCERGGNIGFLFSNPNLFSSSNFMQVIQKRTNSSKALVLIKERNKIERVKSVVYLAEWFKENNRRSES